MATAGKIANLPKKIMHAATIETVAMLDVFRYGLPDIMLQFGGGIGDELLLTSVARELKKRRPHLRIWQVSHSGDLLKCNPDYDRIFSMDHWPLRYALFLEKRRCRLSYAVEVIPRKQEIPPDIHIIAELCRKAGVRGDVSLRTYVFLTDDEKSAGLLSERQIALQCINGDAYPTVMRNKVWYPGRFQKAVDMIRTGSNGRIMILQLGTEGDPLLRGVTDLRGRTSLRESAAILSHSECFIGTPGFLMHLARAVECRSVIIYGGREHSSQTGYICNENLNSYPECAPCWKWDDCAYERQCMDMIREEDVVAAYEKIRTRRHLPLETEVACL
jgi:hypothetical protein